MAASDPHSNEQCASTEKKETMRRHTVALVALALVALAAACGAQPDTPLTNETCR